MKWIRFGGSGHDYQDIIPTLVWWRNRGKPGRNSVTILKSVCGPRLKSGNLSWDVPEVSRPKWGFRVSTISSFRWKI
jgi:hypothetical protein